MYKNQGKFLRSVLIAWDTIVSILSVLISGLLRFSSFRSFSAATSIKEAMLFAIIASFVAFGLSRMYQKFIVRGYFEELKYVFKFVFWFLCVMAILIFGVKNEFELSRLTLFYAIPINFFLLYVSHCLIKIIVRHYAQSQRGWKALLISDTGSFSSVYEETKSSNGWKNNITHLFLIDNKNLTQINTDTIKILKDILDLYRCIRTNAIDEVLIAMTSENFYRYDINKVIQEVLPTGVNISFKLLIPDSLQRNILEITKIGDMYFAYCMERQFGVIEVSIKRMMDIAGSIIGLIITAIVGVIVAPAILLESRGPLFFRQIRIGKNGRRFYLYKFRSMYRDAESRKKEIADQNKMKGPLFKVDNDPRITKVGRFIRKTSIDELPQFFNVLIGDMSLVGTRPPTEDEYAQYSLCYKKRLSFRPGITGIWQTSGRNEIVDFEEVMKMDLQYIQEWSIALDIKLILKTIVVILTGKGAE